ncbi:MAG: baseplate J/gp47 family protein [Deltaproteobacteria bacterium]|nr:baseplate J/gp47 family protein [Deltaproteobacteria bacterium]
MYTTPSYADILDAILTDYANQIPGADISEGSDIYVRASVLASVLWGIYQYQFWIARQVFPDSADSDELERHAAIRGLSRKQATMASGTVTLTGTDGTVVDIGVTLKTSDDVSFETTTGGTITLGVLDVTAQAVEGGSSGNLPASTSLTIQDPPAGVDSSASNALAFTGGTDKEADADLLSRLLDIIRQPPAGGNESDYKQWALEVTGVDAAYVYPLRLGLGSVTVVPLVAGSGSSRIPTQTLVDSVTTHIDALRPVSVKIFQVLAPTAKTQAVTATIKVASGYTFSQVQPWVEDAITAYLNIMQPGEILYKSKLERVISDVEGVDDRSLTVPAANVTPANSGSTIEMICPGTLTITEMA